MVIRDALPEDWDAIWAFFRRIVAAGETYAYDRDMDRPRDAASGWSPPRAARWSPPTRTAPSAARRGRHGTGTWRAARESGYRAIQFQRGRRTNQPAVALWRSLDFTVLATVPEAFDHATHGYVGLLIMHRFL